MAKVKANPNYLNPWNNFHYCGYIGGSDYDYGLGIDVDGSGCAYVTGYTLSDETTDGFPVTSGAGPDLQRQRRRRLRGQGQGESY
ncbi:SBBP repeat-containing protein [Chloroflexota bacterium]